MRFTLISGFLNTVKNKEVCKMNKQRAFTAIYAAVIITAAVLLTVIADKPIGSMAVTVPTMLVLFGSMLLGR